MPEWLLQIIACAAMAGVVYGGIRADLKAMHERIKDVQEAASEAHKRIDGLLMRP